MSNYKGHLIGGFITYLLVAFLLKNNSCSFITLAEWLTCTLLGALFPDVDIKSKGQKYFYRIILILFCILIIKKKYSTVAFFSILSFAPLLTPHRGIFHNIWFLCLVPFVLAILIGIYSPCYKTAILYDTLFFISGSLSHIILDFGPSKVLKKLRL